MFFDKLRSTLAALLLGFAALASANPSGSAGGRIEGSEADAGLSQAIPDSGPSAIVQSSAREKTLANGLYMSGVWNASWSGSSVTLTLDRINNDSFTRSTGTLRLELWAVVTPPARAAGFTGYRLAAFSTLNPLGTRQFYSSIVRSGTMNYPPDGTYWINLVLAEYDPANCSQSDGFCIQDSLISTSQTTFGVPPPPPPPPPVSNFGNFTDLWWNASESGWGVSITHHTTSNVAFIAWYTYDGVGNPKWYVASACRISGNACSDTLYETTGPPFGPTFNPAQVRVTAVGSITLSFSSLNNGTMTYNVRGSTGTKFITRQAF